MAVASAGQTMLPRMASGEGTLLDRGQAGLEAGFVKAICAEIDYCLSTLGEELLLTSSTPSDARGKRAAIATCTRGICCANLLRSANPLNFTLTVADNYYRLHYLRARFEGDRVARRAIRIAVSHFSKKDTSCLDVQSRRRVQFGDGSFSSLFLTTVDWSRLPQSMRPPAAMDVFDCRGQCVPDNPMNWPSPDPAFAQLDCEQRGLMMYMGNSKCKASTNLFFLTTCMEFRWAFHQVASAKAYFKELSKSQAETEPGLGKMRCTPEADVSVEGIDEILVSRTRLAATERQPIGAFCCLLRVGRVCAKMYMSGMMKPGRDLESRLQSLLDDLVSRVAPAIGRRIKAAYLREVPAEQVDLSEAMAAAQLQEGTVMGSWLDEVD